MLRKKVGGGVMNNQKVSGRWTQAETLLHINVLELRAVQFALLTLVPDLTSQNIQIQIDNSSAVAYINHMGGTHSKRMNSIAKEIWDWAIQRNIHLTAVHIPGLENVKADFLSRHFLDQMEWQLNRFLFNKIVLNLFHPQVDLFASRLNY
jgi:hypothetical protein